ncbi:Nuclear GTPase SLIP-GC [Colletotrichum siamense]|uniref:Nuclear GTPase SLIP-GC n=1 Tax=Colletotrichum siamense TaxID=690259 RepID=UPI0018723903|nr:Nuclear GTPase SLIP-GC [Colletotrichum siamense]KAF5500731.1 Nuclear GTPase SLIP-GC [Colletotrichum siamense]
MLKIKAKPASGHDNRTSANMVFSIPSKLKEEKNPKVWEELVAMALLILNKLEPICENIASCSKLNAEIKAAALSWIQQMKVVRERAAQSGKVIIGVFGNTGDGKSSCINALLGEKSLLPTNCGRACTACVTELSYNNDDDPENPYRAQIDFISREEWMHEIEIFLKEVAVNHAGFDDKVTNKQAEVAKSVAKARAVYANMDSKVLLGSSVNDLIRHPHVHEVLGTTREFKASTGDELESFIKLYIDSGDKDGEKAIAYWPMVKAVRIFTKAKALSNGVTIVDLPGSHDDDAARASIASNYMKSCAGIWIVAPIKRAVDNKVAKDLMSDAFKRQLRLDGSLSNVTFICSMTDELEVEEAVKNFKKSLDPDTRQAWKKAIECDGDIRVLQQTIRTLRAKGDTTSKPDDEPDMEQPAKRIKTDEVTEKSKKLEEVRAEQTRLAEKVKKACIQKRNKISRNNLQDYFRSVLREAQQQTAAFNLADNLLDDNMRLPVFCISSRAYQRLEGLSAGVSDSLSGFDDAQDTEIPQLQRHAQGLTDDLRIAKNREVLATISQLLNSISLWTQNVPDFNTALDAEMLRSLLDEFEQEMLSVTEAGVQKLQASIKDGICRKMTALSYNAKVVALEVASGWFKVMHHATLKATFCRGGVWKTRDFNKELLHEYQLNIFDDWMMTFRLGVPSNLDDVLLETHSQINYFHKRIMRQLEEDGQVETQSTKRLRQQRDFHQEAFKRLITQSKFYINEAQKDASRRPLQIIAEQMNPVYRSCMNIKGDGSKKRWRGLIEQHIRAHMNEMFNIAMGGSLYILHQAMDSYVKELTAQTNATVRAMRNDYMMALAKRKESARHHEALLKKDMVRVLELAEMILA